jgi:hypothetical protein
VPIAVRGYLPITRFPRTARVSAISAATWSGSGTARFGGVARKTGSRGNGCRDWPTTGSLSLATFILGRTCVLPSSTQGKNRMPELGPSGSARGAVSDHRPYRDPEQVQQTEQAYSITSSARTRNVSGIISPIAFAILRLRISSILVGSSTGISAGFAPLRILST